MLASSASAVTVVPANCDTLDEALALADNDQEIVLNSDDGPGGLCDDNFTLPSFASPGAGESYKRITLKAAGTDDGFGPDSGRAITGNNSHIWEIQNLIFRGGSVDDDGGAIKVTGESSLAVRGSTFEDNFAEFNGGAVYAEQDDTYPGLFGTAFTDNQFTRNRANGQGGAISIVTAGQGQTSGINLNTFTENVAGTNGGAFDFFLEQAEDQTVERAITAAAASGVESLSVGDNDVLDNRAAGNGGGGHIVVRDASDVSITTNLFEGNTVGEVEDIDTPSQEHFGGGLFIQSGSSQIRQRENDFLDNEVEEFVAPPPVLTAAAVEPGTSYGGGGEAIASSVGTTIRSDFDTFKFNEVAGQPEETGEQCNVEGPECESEGGGIYIEGFRLTFHAWLAVVSANHVGARGEAGGIYIGGVSNSLELSDTTVAGNTVGEEGEAGGLSGGNNGDHLQLRNSIVFNNTPTPDIDGFSSYDVDFSDACSEGGPFPGDGNICEDPRLANPANGDIHQTKQSPTIDKGNDELFFAEEEDPDADFEGDPRPTDGDGDGHTVDMGADESPAGFIAPGTVSIIGQPGQTPQCSDGVDNDSDGAIDRQDPGCLSGQSYNPLDNNEADETLRDLVLCGRRNISLVRADARGPRVALSGLVGARFAGRRVGLFANDGGGWEKVKSVTSKRSGSFRGSVAGPPPHLFNKIRYQARIGRSRSVALKLPQSLASTSVRKRGQNIVVRGKVKRSLLGKRNRVIVRRLVCGHYLKVGAAKPDRSGNYVIRFKAPRLGTAALYRAETRVLDRPGSRRYVKQYARAIGIRLTGSTG